MRKKLRCGFTTGSCAAAAAKAAVYMLLTGQEKNEMTIRTPKGVLYHAQIHDISRGDDFVCCAVEKDGGDDADVTTGSYIYAKVWAQETPGQPEGVQITVEGGPGVGRVTRPGLDQPVGSAAINRVPREMIAKGVKEVCETVDFCGRVSVEISVPNGEELSRKTFNPRLGIEGGISILGTTGIVEPMSEKALLETIRAQLRQHRAMGERVIVLSPGNYGAEFMKNTFGYELDKSVKCSNFIGNALDMAAEEGFDEVLLAGHIGKLIKVSGGIMNTHSKEGDCRMELLAAAALKEGVEVKRVCRILDCVSTDEALSILKETDRFQRVMDAVMERILFYLNRRAAGELRVECMMYSNGCGELASSGGAKELLRGLTERG